jgi:hypothetical protein
MAIAISVFVVLALLTYPLVLFFNLIVSPSSGDNLDVGFAGFFTMVVWFNLSVALLLVAIRKGTPWWSWIAAPLLLLFYVMSSVRVSELLKDNQPVRWMIVVPLTGPLMMLAYLAWAWFPRLHNQLSAHVASTLLWGGLFVLTAIPWQRSEDLRIREDARRQKWQAPIRAHVEQLKQIPDDAPVQDLLPFLGYYETQEKAMQRIRASSHKEADFEQMMKSGDYSAFFRLYEFALSPTRGLCECARQWLREQIAVPATGENFVPADVAHHSPYTSTLQWIADGKCPMLDEINQYEALLRTYPDSNEDFLKGTFVALDQIKRTLREETSH